MLGANGAPSLNDAPILADDHHPFGLDRNLCSALSLHASPSIDQPPSKSPWDSPKNALEISWEFLKAGISQLAKRLVRPRETVIT